MHSSFCGDLIKTSNTGDTTLGPSGNENAVFNVLGFSSSMQTHFDTCVVDEGSTSAKKSGGYIRSLVLAPRMVNPEIFTAKSNCQLSQLSSDSEPSSLSNYSELGSGCSIFRSQGHQQGQKMQVPTSPTARN